jgi:hypothetical protein
MKNSLRFMLPITASFSGGFGDKIMKPSCLTRKIIFRKESGFCFKVDDIRGKVGQLNQYNGFWEITDLP